MVELRRYERVSFLCKLELTAIPEGHPTPARSLDLSLGGVGVSTQAVFEVGQLMSVAFYFKDAGHHEVIEEVVGRVARLLADPDANVLGIQFLHPLTDAENPRLVGKLLSSV